MDDIQPMADVESEIAAYKRMQNELESKLMGKWVLVRDGVLVSSYDSFESAAQDAVKRFGRGPYLIRQVGAAPASLPASVMFKISHA